MAHPRPAHCGARRAGVSTACIACYASLVRIPIWVTLAVATFVLAFGSYRIWLGVRKEPPREGDEPPQPPSRSVFASGFARMGKRAHVFVGIIYVLLGIALVATSFGWNPIGQRTEDAPPNSAPANR